MLAGQDAERLSSGDERSEVRLERGVRRFATDNGKKGRKMETITMRVVQYLDGTWGVQLELTGLASEKQAQAGMHHMERMLCAGEIKTQ